MNTLLEQLFDKYSISPKDRHEINQIYWLLPDNKKQNLINNFEVLSIRLNKIEEDLKIEREILVWDSLKNIKNAIERAKRDDFKKQILI